MTKPCKLNPICTAEECVAKDRLKTREINILTRENRALALRLNKIRIQMDDWWNLLRTNPTLIGNAKLAVIQRILEEDTP